MGSKRKRTFHENQLRFFAVVFGILIVGLTVLIIWLLSRPGYK